jgi:hypothetical protein
MTGKSRFVESCSFSCSSSDAALCRLVYVARTGGGRTLAQGDCRYFPNLGGSLLLCPDAPGQHEVFLSVLMAPNPRWPASPREAGLQFVTHCPLCENRPMRLLLIAIMIFSLGAGANFAQTGDRGSSPSSAARGSPQRSPASPTNMHVLPPLGLLPGPASKTTTPVSSATTPGTTGSTADAKSTAQ